MLLKELIGNRTLAERMISIVDEKRLPHAVMFVEEDGYGALPLTLGLIQYISGDNNRIQKLIHPDLHFVFPVNISSKKSSDKKPTSDTFITEWRNLVSADPYFSEERLNEALGIEDKIGAINVTEAKNILSIVNMRAYEGGNKYIVVWLPEKMTNEAANKLLKAVEEPYEGTYFFFITHSFEKVIKTISSRCSTFYLQPILDSRSVQSPFFPIVSSIIEYSLSKNLTEAMDQYEKIALMGREKQRDFCMYFETFIRELYLQKLGLCKMSSTKNKEEEEKISRIIPHLKDTFYEKSFLFCDNAKKAIEGNTNSKMVFLNLCNQIFLTV